MKLYHGSNMEILVPDLTKSKPYKDFGKGFYLSAVYSQALARAKQIAELYGFGTPYVSTFFWDEREATEMGLNIKRFDDYSQEWAEFILANRDRNRIHPIHFFDIVIGPIADDGVTYQLRRYTGGYISMEQLTKELKFSKGLTIQYYFGTERALKTLKRI